MRQLTEDDIDEYMSGWNFFDKNLTGYIDQSLVKSLLKSLRPPLGLPQDTTNAEFIRFCRKLNIKARNGKVHYQELIVMLHRIACNPGQPVSEEVLRRNKLTDRHIHRKIQLAQEKVERDKWKAALEFYNETGVMDVSYDGFFKQNDLDTVTKLVTYAQPDYFSESAT